ncbi:MAG: TerB family tellurite resistance protein [Myxococcales bacterium]|jgi:uncharacterized tellurite resistance protein B-like protein|nr:TerB family tellurite resistance protein [Myxococcales bacterium]
MSQHIDLSNPKESAVLDLLALAIAADGHVDAREIAFATDRFQALLGIGGEANVGFVDELGKKISESIQRLKDEGAEVFMQSAVVYFDTEEEREMAFALCAALVCVDGSLAPGEAEFLSQLRVLLGMSEAQVLRGVVAISTQLMAHSPAPQAQCDQH